MIIFDASTLILITKIELLEPFLAILSMPSAIPREVHRECCGSKKTLDSLVIQKAVDDSRIQVLAVKNRKLADRLRDDFALQTSALLVGMDDKNGINACKLLGISFTSAAGILILCRQRNLIGLDDALVRLDRLATYGRYKTSIVDDVRIRLEVDT
jgi:predicted nucleic acid-binding protein